MLTAKVLGTLATWPEPNKLPTLSQNGYGAAVGRIWVCSHGVLPLRGRMGRVRAHRPRVKARRPRVRVYRPQIRAHRLRVRAQAPNQGPQTPNQGPQAPSQRPHAFSWGLWALAWGPGALEVIRVERLLGCMFKGGRLGHRQMREQMETPEAHAHL